MAKPAIETHWQKKAKRKRCLALSLMKAVSMAKPNAAAQGGTECTVFKGVCQLSSLDPRGRGVRGGGGGGGESVDTNIEFRSGYIRMS